MEEPKVGLVAHEARGAPEQHAPPVVRRDAEHALGVGGEHEVGAVHDRLGVLALVLGAHRLAGHVVLEQVLVVVAPLDLVGLDQQRLVERGHKRAKDVALRRRGLEPVGPAQHRLHEVEHQVLAAALGAVEEDGHLGLLVREPHDLREPSQDVERVLLLAVGDALAYVLDDGLHERIDLRAVGDRL